MQYIQLSNRNLDGIAYTVVKFDEKHLLPCAIKCDHLTIQVFSTLGNVHNEICRFRRYGHSSCRYFILQHLAFLR